MNVVTQEQEFANSQHCYNLCKQSQCIHPSLGTAMSTTRTYISKQSNQKLDLLADATWHHAVEAHNLIILLVLSAPVTTIIYRKSGTIYRPISTHQYSPDWSELQISLYKPEHHPSSLKQNPSAEQRTERT